MTRRRHESWAGCGASVLALVLLGACSPASGQIGPHGAGSGGSSSGGGAGGGGSGDLTGAGGLLAIGTIGAAAAPNDGGLDGANCGSVSIDTSVETVTVPGNVLIVFDQSDSMVDDFGTEPKWQVASDALVQAITPEEANLTVGAVFFPTAVTLGGLLPGECDITTVAAIDDMTGTNHQIPFQPAAQFIGAWTAHWAANPLTLGTPTVAGLTRGDQALSAATLTGNTVVILVTDGEPTCGTNQEAIDLATKWKGEGIPTYVIGLPGAGSVGQKVATLSDIAAAGGTTDYVLPSDAADLQQLFTTITSTTVKHSLNGCSIAFNEKPVDPNRVFLDVTEADSGQRYSVPQGPDGWTPAPDWSSATLNGTLCTDATAGRYSNIAFGFGCNDAPVLH